MSAVHCWGNPLHWVLDRLHCAIDITGLTQEQIDAYIALTRSGTVPVSFKKLHHDDWIGSAIFGNKSERIQFYDKGRQMNRNHPDADEAVLAAFQGVLRVEVQIKSDCLSRTLKKAGWSYRTLGQFLQPGFAEAIVRQRAGEVIGTGSYRSAGRARQSLAAAKTNAVIKAPQYRKLNGFIAFLQGQASLHSAREQCKNGAGPVSVATFDSYVRQLAEQGINLPVIPTGYAVQDLMPLLPHVEDCKADTLNEWLEQWKSARKSKPLLIPSAVVPGIDRVRPVLRLCKDASQLPSQTNAAEIQSGQALSVEEGKSGSAVMENHTEVVLLCKNTISARIRHHRLSIPVLRIVMLPFILMRGYGTNVFRLRRGPPCRVGINLDNGKIEERADASVCAGPGLL